MDLNKINEKIKNIKRITGALELNENEIDSNPFKQFVIWFDEAITSNTCDPTSMILATSDENNIPDTRVVLLKELAENAFIFYTNYNSNKARQLSNNHIAAINFYWPQLARQVRIKGNVSKVEKSHSETYFLTRPRESQIGAHAWIQSMPIANRQELENRVALTKEKFADHDITCPEGWGGYQLVPFEYEFFQGRKWRFNDRILYTSSGTDWKISRLAP